jgi:hypothetical protein
MIDGWFEIRCDECDEVIGYAFNRAEEPCSWAFSCEECMNPETGEKGLDRGSDAK